ncbi:hypothetical protein [Acinetobacter sp. WCHAc060025]|uniref:hypothetical protein n=1 Tax=Acinetobacter sp. WCHAc060025 TaxID=2518625 RepID=UPI001022FDE7|nr:hypothetical protein [Acinetobacter sp. WCHAc060025]RZG75364.1 hypothetical protein EXE09_10740 [Acinetobacter sp. WCHAc060025]
MHIILVNFLGIYDDLNRSQKFFLFGAVIAFCTLFWKITPFDSIYQVSFYALFIILLLGVISDLLFIYHKVWATTIGKALLVLFYVLLTTTTYAAADQVVNVIVAYDSSTLSRTSAFVAILLIPLVILIATGIVFLIILLLGQFYLVFITYFQNLKNDKFLSRFIPNIVETYPGWSCIARFFSYPMVFGVLLSIGQIFNDKYQIFLTNTTQSFIYNFEAKLFSRCIIPTDSKVINISENEIIIVTKLDGGYEFKPSLCEPKLKK